MLPGQTIECKIFGSYLHLRCLAETDTTVTVASQSGWQRDLPRVNEDERMAYDSCAIVGRKI